MSLKDYTWESFEFPITIINISCEFGRYNFPSESIIEINRTKLPCEFYKNKTLLIHRWSEY
jgi:hypothetical protein